MISLRDILNSNKTFVVDTIEVLNMHGSEVSENFGVSPDETQDEHIPLDLKNLYSFDDKCETVEKLDYRNKENEEKTISNNSNADKEQVKQHVVKVNENADRNVKETRVVEQQTKFTFSEAQLIPDYDFGFDQRESELFHRLSIYDDCRRSSTLLDSLSEDHDDKEGGTDDMNEMDMPNPGSIQHFQRLFYPSVPCMNCASCYDKFTNQIFGDSI